MNGIFRDLKKLESTSIDGRVGAFAIDRVPFQLHDCRERFAAHFMSDTTGIYMKMSQNRGENIAKFLWKTEDILNESCRSEFALTSYSTILWISPTYFWRACPLRRSLLTILLRAANEYSISDDNYENALFSQEFVIPTKKAVMRFLFGFTKYTGPDFTSTNTGTLLVTGWKQIFDRKGDDDVKRLLVWPTENQYVPEGDYPQALWI